MEKRHLVYTTWNGRINAHIEFGSHSTGTGEKKRWDEVTRFELKSSDNNDIDELKKLYPYTPPEEVKNV